MKFKEILVSFVIFGILLLITFFVLDYYVLPRYVRKGAVVEVPDVTGLYVDEAVDTFKKYELVPYIKAYVVGPRDTVVDTDPPPLMKVKKGRRVGLLLGQGEEE